MVFSPLILSAMMALRSMRKSGGKETTVPSVAVNVTVSTLSDEAAIPSVASV